MTASQPDQTSFLADVDDSTRQHLKRGMLVEAAAGGVYVYQAGDELLAEAWALRQPYRQDALVSVMAVRRRLERLGAAAARIIATEGRDALRHG